KWGGGGRPFRGDSAAETERQVISDEPVPPVRLNPRTPRDLQTICLKCLQKSPARRYATAAALADDLVRFWRGEPIAARRAGVAERVVKWVRRRPTLATFVATTGVVSMALLCASLWWAARQSTLSGAVAHDLADVTQAITKSDWPSARTALERAKARMDELISSKARSRVEGAQRELDLVEELETIRLNRATIASV